MNKIKLMGFALLIPLGIFMFIYGGYDDSPGAQGLGVLAVIGSMIGIFRNRKSNFKISKPLLYQHTQIGYLMIVVFLIVLSLFAWSHIMASIEPPSYNSGTNFAFTAIMALILFVLASFTALSVSIDENYIKIKFGYGILSIFHKKFSLSEIASISQVKNHWCYGWGIRLWFCPKMWIFNVSGFDAVELKMKNGKIYRIGTDEPEELEKAIKRVKSF